MKTTKEKIAVLTECIAIIKEFDAGLAKPEKTGSDIVRELLKEGKPVLVIASGVSQEVADKINTELFLIAVFENGFFEAITGEQWRYVSPTDTSAIASYVPEVE